MAKGEKAKAELIAFRRFGGRHSESQDVDTYDLVRGLEGLALAMDSALEDPTDSERASVAANLAQAAKILSSMLWYRQEVDAVVKKPATKRQRELQREADESALRVIAGGKI